MGLHAGISSRVDEPVSRTYKLQGADVAGTPIEPATVIFSSTTQWSDSINYLRSGQAQRNLTKRKQGGFEVLDNFLLKHIGWRQVIQVVQAVIF